MSILSARPVVNNSSICAIAGCQLDQHDEAAPTLHQGVTKYSDTWSVDSAYDEAEGEWGVSPVSTYRRDLTTEEARAYAEAILLVASWCEVVSASRGEAA